MISSRYAIPVIILLALALIPTTIHSYIDAKVHDGKSLKDVSLALGNFTSTPANRNSRWGMDVFGSEDWFERDYRDKQHHKVRLFAARAYDHKRLYHHPELALSYGHSLTDKDIQHFPSHPEIPVFILWNNDHSMLVAYVLLYDDEFVADPIKHQLSESLRLLVGSRKPMTLFYASQMMAPSDIKFSHSAVAPLLSLAIQNFQSAPKSTE